MKQKVVIIIMLLVQLPLMAQTIEERHDRFYSHSLSAQQKPIPYPFLREADVAWKYDLWKSIDLHELFNQYMYFPLDDNDRSGKKSLAYVLWEAMASGEIPIYEDDELKIPIDNEFFVRQYTKADTIQLEIGYDEDDNEIYQTVVKPKFFDGAEIFRYTIRESWFIGRADTRLESRRIALAPMKDVYHTLKSSGEEIFLGTAALFWVPMQNPAVRALLARTTAYYDDNNMVNQPSWDYVFVNMLYHAYVTRETNLFNRTVSSYVTGEDAMYEAAAIEQKVFEIGDDMWDY